MKKLTEKNLEYLTALYIQYRENHAFMRKLEKECHYVYTDENKNINNNNNYYTFLGQTTMVKFLIIRFLEIYYPTQKHKILWRIGDCIDNDMTPSAFMNELKAL